MKAKPRSLALAFGVAAFAAAFVWLFATRGPLAPVAVTTAPVEVAELRPAAYGIGTVEARHAYAVGPIQAGRLLRVTVDHGDRVQAGQLLAEMDPVDLGARTEAAASAIARARQAAQAAQAQVDEAASRAGMARASLARYEALQRRNFVAPEMVDGYRHERAAAEAALEAAQANAAAARREIARAEAERSALLRQRDSLRLLSPVDGVVTAREAEPGTTVVAGQAVLRLVDPARLWVRARVDQARAEGVAVGQPADIVLRSAPGSVLRGTVARIDLQSDVLTEERIVNVAFDAPPARLYLGELAEVTIRLPGASEALSVPRAALAQQGGQPGVWQVDGGRARFTPVQIGVQTAERVEITSGPGAGERVVVYSAGQLAPDVRVRAQRQAP